MKRAKLATLVALAAFALASCDAMLEALFPEFGSDDQGNFGDREIHVTVFVGDGGGPGYTRGGHPPNGDIRVIAVKWSFDQFGYPALITDGTGHLDNFIHHFIVGAPEVLVAGSAPGMFQDFTIFVPPDNFAVVVFEDVDDNGVPNGNESAAIALWKDAPPELFGEEFDVGYQEFLDPEVTTLQAITLVLVHESYNDPNLCLGALSCGDFDTLY